MHLQIFAEFIARERLPPVKVVVSDPLTPRNDKERSVLETNVKLFYPPGANVEPLVNELIDPAPYTLIASKQTRYRRVLKERISSEQLLARRSELVTADLEFRDGLFELYELVPGELETVQTRDYYGDRMIFKLTV